MQDLDGTTVPTHYTVRTGLAMEINPQQLQRFQTIPSAPAWKGNLYRTLAQNFPNGAVLLFDRELRYMLADGMGLADVGLSSEIVEGRTIWDLFPDDVCRVLEPRYRAALAGEASNFDVAYAGRIFQVHVLPIHDDQGWISSGMVMTQDVTDQKLAQETLRRSEQRYEQLVNTIDSIVWEGDATTFRYHFVSQQAERLLGYPVDRWTNEPDFWSAHIHPDDRDWAVNFCSLSTAQKKDHVFEYRMIAADGRVVWLRDIVTVVVENDRPVALRGVMVDITDEINAYQLLEERVAQRTQELQTLLDVSREVAANLDLNTLFGNLFEQLKKVVDFTALTVWMVEDGDEMAIIEYQGPFSREKVFERWNNRFHLADIDPVRRVKPVIIPNVRAETPLAKIWQDDMITQFGEIPAYISSWMSIPLLVKNQTIGLFSLHHEQVDYYTPQHAQLAFALANQIAVVIENARLYEKSQKLAALQERQKLARELHDSVSQALYGIALGSRTARMVLDRQGVDKQALIEPLDYVLSLAEAGLAEMRALIFELRPESLENEGLVSALRKQAEAFKARHQIDMRTSFCEEPDLALKAKESLYRIAQEALHNVFKHAQATQVDLRLSIAGGNVALEVRDNGIGFDPQGSFPGHLGLQSMRERVERLGGDICIESTPGLGSCVRVQVVLDPSKFA